MSLKGFHIVFITACATLSLALVAYFLREYREDGGAGLLVGAAVSLLSGGALVVYGKWFMKKMSRLP